MGLRDKQVKSMKQNVFDKDVLLTYCRWNLDQQKTMIMEDVSSVR